MHAGLLLSEVTQGDIAQHQTKPLSRKAIVVTLAGSHKLSPYFEWSCRSFVHAGDGYTLLVFHEGNSALKAVECPANVQFIDLGAHGLSKLIVDNIFMASNSSSQENRGLLAGMMNDVMSHIPVSKLICRYTCVYRDAHSGISIHCLRC
jgi:hypothetical protein